MPGKIVICPPLIHVSGDSQDQISSRIDFRRQFAEETEVIFAMLKHFRSNNNIKCPVNIVNLLLLCRYCRAFQSFLGSLYGVGGNIDTYATVSTMSQRDQEITCPATNLKEIFKVNFGEKIKNYYSFYQVT